MFAVVLLAGDLLSIGNVAMARIGDRIPSSASSMVTTVWSKAEASAAMAASVLAKETLAAKVKATAKREEVNLFMTLGILGWLLFVDRANMSALPALGTDVSHGPAVTFVILAHPPPFFCIPQRGRYLARALDRTMSPRPNTPPTPSDPMRFDNTAVAFAHRSAPPSCVGRAGCSASSAPLGWSGSVPASSASPSPCACPSDGPSPSLRLLLRRRRHRGQPLHLRAAPPSLGSRPSSISAPKAKPANPPSMRPRRNPRHHPSGTRRCPLRLCRLQGERPVRQ